MKDDAISRRAVLKLLSTMPPEDAVTKAMLIQSVKQMDAAQPSGPDNLVKDSQGLAKELVNDCISRQAAIEAIKEDKIDLTNPNVVAVFKATGDFGKVETQVMTCDRHIEILKDLPSAQLKSYRSYREGYQAGFNEGYQAGFKDAQPERQKGEWIDYTEDGYVECPFCHSATNCDGNKDELHFCFSCGADMREVDDERPD